jgi:hypothetical protein
LAESPGLHAEASVPRSNFVPGAAKEIAAAHEYVRKVGGAIVLMQRPNKFSRSEPVLDLAAALGVPSFTSMQPASARSTCRHMDAASAELYTKEAFAWLEQLSQFKKIETARLQ